MKKSVFLFFLLLPSIVACFSQIKLESDGCTYRIIDYGEWKQLSVTVDPRAAEYLDNFSSAIKNPGAFIVVGESERFRLKAVFKKNIQTEKRLIVYDDKAKMIKYLESIDSEEKTSYLILLLFLSTILMIRANILFKKSKERRLGAAIIALIIFMLAVFPLRLTIFAGIFCLAVFISAFLVVLFSELPDSRKYYWWTSKIFYFSMVVFTILLFF